MLKSVICMVLVLGLCSPALVHAESLPYLQEGLTLKYQLRYSWAAPHFGNGEFGISEDLTIRVLAVDQSNDNIRIGIESSAVVTFPPGTKSSSLRAVNYDGSKPVFKFSSDAKEFELESTSVLNGRITESVDGDRVDLIWLRADGNFADWTYCYVPWFESPPIGYPSKYFLYPGMSLGDNVLSYRASYGEYGSRPQITESVVSISGMTTYSSPLGDRDTLFADRKSTEGAWHGERQYFWDKETGILVYQTDSLTADKGAGEEKTVDEIRLVEASPWPIVVKTTTSATSTVVSTTANATTSKHASQFGGYRAVWLDIDKFRPEVQLEDFRRDISDHSIQFVFVSFTYIRSDGTGTNRDIPSWIEKLHPAIVVAVMNNKDFTFDLKDDSTRERLADEAKFLCDKGFDGVQLDIEQTAWRLFGGPNEADFNSLVQLIRTKIGNKHLSMALPARTGSFWETWFDSTKNWADYATLARYADYLIPMCYDYRGLQSYRDWVSDVTEYSLNSVSGTNAKILLGVTVQEGHGSLSEALDGAKQALLGNKNGYAGLSVFNYENIHGEDWERIDSF